MRSTTTRTTAVAALLAAATLLLTSCTGHVDAGSAGADAARDELARIDGVATVRADGSNDLPFAGTTTATVVTEDDLSDDRLQRVTDAVGRWIADHRGSVTYSADVEADGFVFTVQPTKPANARVLDVVDGLRGDERWLGAVLSVRGEVRSLDLQVADPADLVTGWTAVQAAADGSGWDDVTATASAWDDPARDTTGRRDPDWSITDSAGDPATEVAALGQVATAHRLTAATVRRGLVHVHTADLGDVPDVTAVLERAAPDAAAIVDGGVVTKRDPGDDVDERPDAGTYAEADRLARVAVRPGVSAVALTRTGVTVTAADVDTALAAAEALAAASPVAPVRTLSVGSSAAAAAGDHQGLLVQGSADRLGASAAVARRLTAFLPARASFFGADPSDGPSPSTPTSPTTTTNASISATLQRIDDVPAFVQAVRPVLPDGTTVQVGIAGQLPLQTAQLTLRDGRLTIDRPRAVATDDDARVRLAEAVREAWNG